MAATELETGFVGRRAPLFRLAFVGSLLTILTLGLYRFWMKSRLRRYYWSSICPGGQPLEYVGLPQEKLVGFLIAVVFMAFYLGLANLALLYLSFSLLNTDVPAYALSLAGVVPLWFYASYRARRYILARTRWRGIRFGVDRGAWGYVWRAMVHWLITLLSLGLLWPRMTFALERYRAERTWFGSERLTQGGRWQMLYPAFLPVLGAVALGLIGAVVAARRDEVTGTVMVLAAGVVLAYGVVHYRVSAFRLLSETKTLGGLGFSVHPRPLRIFGVYVLGFLLAAVVIGAVFFGLVLLFFALVPRGTPGALLQEGAGGDLPLLLTATLGVGAYVLFFFLWGVLRQGLITLPLLRHYTDTLRISGALSLPDIHQRERDEMQHAEGFAEALDVGAAL